MGGKSKADIQREIKAKDKAVKRLVQQFSNQGYGRSEADGLSDEEIEWCLYSMGDNSSFLVFNRDPVDKMISYLTTNFPTNLPADSPGPCASGLGTRGPG